MNDDIETQRREVVGSPAFDPDPTQKIICWKQRAEAGPIPIMPLGWERNALTLVNVGEDEIMKFALGLLFGLDQVTRNFAVALLDSYTQGSRTNEFAMRIAEAERKLHAERAERAIWSTRA